MSKKLLIMAAPVVALIYVVLSALITVAFDHWSVWRGPLVEDREALWRLRPGFSGSPGFAESDPSLTPATIDAQGFRTTANRPGSDRQHETILAIGDSFTFGWDVADQETYPSQLQAILDGRAPGRFEVLNGGMPGCTSFQAEQLLRRWIPRFKPAVLITLLGRNDGRQAYLSDRDVHRILRWKPDLLNYVFPFMFLHYRNVQTLAQASGRGLVQRVSNEEFKTNMEDIVELARASKVKLIVLEPWTGQNPAFRLAGLAAAHGVPYIDTPERLADAAAEGHELFIRSHYHPNRDGYAVIAAALADAILRGG